MVLPVIQGAFHVGCHQCSGSDMPKAIKKLLRGIPFSGVYDKSSENSFRKILAYYFNGMGAGASEN